MIDLSLDEHEIHLWMVDYAEIGDAGLQREYLELLSDEERAQQRRFYFERDRLRFLVTRALIRTTLSRYAPLDPKNWIFSSNAYGRPAIANEIGKTAGLSFNVSHTHSLIVLGVSRHRDIGVDVENYLRHPAPLDLADQYFSHEEAATLALLPPSDRQYRFFEYWTCKESYIKARGMGLSLPLDQFGFRYHDRRVEIAFDDAMDDEPVKWAFWQLLVPNNYLVAVCAPVIPDRSTHLVVRSIVPLRREQDIAAELLRASGRDTPSTAL